MGVVGSNTHTHTHTLLEWVISDRGQPSVQGQGEKTADVGTNPGNAGALARVQR